MIPHAPQLGVASASQQPADVQIRYTTENGPLIRLDGRTSPTTLDAIEARYGEYVLNHLMENYGRWVDVSAPACVTVTATVNGREYEVHVVPADEIASDFVVDTDEGLIILPINATMFAVVQALGTAAQHEPPPPLPNSTAYALASLNFLLDVVGLPPLAPIRNRPVKLDPDSWPRSAA